VPGEKISNLNTSTPTPRLLTTFLILPTLKLPQGPRRANGSPLICRPGGFETAARQAGLVGHFLFSAIFLTMGKQKNRLTATKPQNHIAQVTYPAPTLDPKHPVRPQHYRNLLDQTCLPCTCPTLTRTHGRLYRPSCPPCRRNQSCLPYTSTPQIAHVEAAYPVAAKNGQPCAHLRSSLPYTRPPAQVGPRASTYIDKDKLAYPIPPSPQAKERRPTPKSTKFKQPTLHPSRHAAAGETGLPTARDARTIDFHQVKPAYPAPADRRRRIKSTQNPTPLQLPELLREIIGEIEAKDGLPSADRNNKATLLLTGPFRTAKSSAKDLTPLVLKLQYAKYHDALRAPWKNRLLRR
jgi:hypothetical protein